MVFSASEATRCGRISQDSASSDVPNILTQGVSFRSISYIGTIS
jgi:hypothetical protein